MRQELHAYPIEGGGFLVTDHPLAPGAELVEPEEAPHPSFVPLILSILALSGILAVGILSPYQQPEVRETLRVPVILLPLRTYSISVKVIPTGKKTSPATRAQGALTITNGSILSEELPQGLILTSKNGVEVETDAAVFVPPGSATGLGYATVSAHAVVSGTMGNIPMLAINQVEGTSLYIRNLQAFTGGKNGFTNTFITQTDRTSALEKARSWLTEQSSAGILAHPCAETFTGNLQVTWKCQYVTYHVPSYMKVIGVQFAGNNFLVDVVFVARPRIFPGK